MRVVALAMRGLGPRRREVVRRFIDAHPNLAGSADPLLEHAE